MMQVPACVKGCKLIAPLRCKRELAGEPTRSVDLVTYRDARECILRCTRVYLGSKDLVGRGDEISRLHESAVFFNNYSGHSPVPRTDHCWVPAGLRPVGTGRNYTK